jgi:hypothetical protein
VKSLNIVRAPHSGSTCRIAPVCAPKAAVSGTTMSPGASCAEAIGADAASATGTSAVSSK